MDPVRLALLLVLVAFLGLTAWAVPAGGGLPGLTALLGASPWAVQLFVDLGLALAMACVFVWRDARARGTSPWPWILATPFVGSIAPLAYFVVRPGADPAPATARGATAKEGW